MSSTVTLPPHEQLCNRYCSNKHTHEARSELVNFPREGKEEGLFKSKLSSAVIVVEDMAMAMALPDSEPESRIPFREGYSSEMG
jgi:hypothetical protein